MENWSKNYNNFLSAETITHCCMGGIKRYKTVNGAPYPVWIGMPPTRFLAASLNTANVGHIDPCLVLIGRVVDVANVGLSSIKRAHSSRGRAHSYSMPLRPKPGRRFINVGRNPMRDKSNIQCSTAYLPNVS